MRKRQKKILCTVMLIGMLFTSFAAAYWNLFDQSEQEFFDEFQGSIPNCV